MDSIEVGGRHRAQEQPIAEDKYDEYPDTDLAIPTVRGGGGSNKKKPLTNYDDISISEDRPIRAAPTGNYKEVDDGGAGGFDDEANEQPDNQFPPGQHPLEGVNNCTTLPSPKDLAGLSK